MLINWNGVLSTEIPGGYLGTVKTIDLMRKLTREGAQDERVRRLAVQIICTLPQRDYAAEAEALLKWMQWHLRYTRDPWTPDGTERVQHPWVTLGELRTGDCDDLTVAYCALAGSIGFPYAFRTVGIDPSRPLEFTHVFALVQIDGTWRPVDPMFQTSHVGWQPPFRTKADGPGPLDGKIATFRDWSA